MGVPAVFFEFAKFRIPKYLNSKICVRWTCWRSGQTLPSARVTKNASALLNVSAGRTSLLTLLSSRALSRHPTAPTCPPALGGVIKRSSRNTV